MASDSYFIRFFKYTLVLFIVLLIVKVIMDFITDGRPPLETISEEFRTAIVMSVFIGMFLPLINSKETYRVYTDGKEELIDMELQSTFEKMKYELLSMEGRRFVYVPSSRYKQIVSLFEDYIEIERDEQYLTISGYWHKVRKLIKKLRELSSSIQRVDGQEAR